jgi:hypothetical protein
MPIFISGTLFSHRLSGIIIGSTTHKLTMRFSFKFIISAVIFVLAIPGAYAQFSDNFSNGNFTENPTWAGNTNDWVVNGDLQLQSNNTQPNSNFYLSTANAKATIAQWDFWVRLAFNPSGTNYVDLYLTASQSNITLASTTGYFVRLGDTPDEVSLYRKNANGTSTKIIDGLDGLLNNSNNVLRVRVVRDENNQWTLSRDFGATGAFIPEGSVTDATFNTSSFFGIWVRQSTASFFQRHFFDDIEVKNYVPDTTPPAIVSANATSANVLEVLFNEALNTPSATNPLHYQVNNSIGNPVSAIPDAANPLLIRLNFGSPFPNGVTNQLQVNGVRDLAGNVLTNGTTNFAFYAPQRFDVVIHELMVDPLPQVGLPNANWIELRNTSAFPINIQGYRLARSAGISGPLPAFVLLPDSMVLVCTGLAVPLLSPYGPTLSVTSFPTLPNGGDLIWLTDASGSLMHSVQYDISWYQNTVKAEGGWTLEMIDARNPCSGSNNWRASTNPAGGTPARANSIAGNNPDNTPPQLIRAFAPNANNIVLSFNERLDSVRAINATYTIGNGIGNATSVTVLPPALTQVSISIGAPLQPGVVYSITVSGLTDCSGNTIGAQNSSRVGLASPADSLDLIVNEILFNPVPLGVDYLELYNRSNNILDAGSIFVTNRSSTTGNLGTLNRLSPTNQLIFPGEYYVLTENTTIISQQFMVQNPDFLFEATSMPSFPDDKGTAVILNNTGQIIDELSYDQRWHFALISNNEGISLERIDPDKPTNNPVNWTSAAQSAGFGTPTSQNSQFRKNVGAPTGNITINPAMFSPDNDGFEDFTFIEFQFTEPGFVANVTIYDAAGRPLRVLQRNTTIGISGTFRWDGLNDKQQRVPAGNYIIYFEAFNLRGQKQVFKKGVTVAKKF